MDGWMDGRINCDYIIIGTHTQIRKMTVSSDRRHFSNTSTSTNIILHKPSVFPYGWWLGGWLTPIVIFRPWAPDILWQFTIILQASSLLSGVLHDDIALLILHTDSTRKQWTVTGDETWNEDVSSELKWTGVRIQDGLRTVNLLTFPSRLSWKFVVISCAYKHGLMIDDW